MELRIRSSDVVKTCNLCGSTESRWALIAHRERFDIPIGSCICLDCGLVFLTPRMTTAEAAEFYRDGIYRMLTEKTNRKTPWRQSQAIYAAAVVQAIHSTMQHWAGAKLLDVGGSTGIVAAALADAFHVDPTVVDPSEAETAEARGLGLDAITGTIDAVPACRQYDIVTAFQTIDHFLDIAGSLQKMRERLRPGGLLIVDICEIGLVLAAKQNVEQTCKVDHPYGLTMATMEAYLRRAGFAILQRIKWEGIPKVLYVCRRDVPDPSAIPSMESVVLLLGLLAFVRATQYEAEHSQPHRKPGSSETPVESLRADAQGTGGVVDRLPDGGYD